MLLEAETIAQLLPQPTRRLAGTVLTAFHQACDQDEPDAAAALLRIAEGLVKRRQMVPAIPAGNQGLLAARERLRLLRRPGGA